MVHSIPSFSVANPYNQVQPRQILSNSAPLHFGGFWDRDTKSSSQTEIISKTGCKLTFDEKKWIRDKLKLEDYEFEQGIEERNLHILKKGAKILGFIAYSIGDCTIKLKPSCKNRKRKQTLKGKEKRKLKKASKAIPTDKNMLSEIITSLRQSKNTPEKKVKISYISYINGNDSTKLTLLKNLIEKLPDDCEVSYINDTLKDREIKNFSSTFWGKAGFTLEDEFSLLEGKVGNIKNKMKQINLNG